NPCVATATETHRQVAPCLAARLALPWHRIEAPHLLSGLRVERADEATDAIEARASRQALKHLVADDHCTAGVDALRFRRRRRRPEDLTVARADGHHRGVARRQE